MGWLYDVLFVVWQYGLTECMTAITHFCDLLHLGCDCNEESQFEGGHVGGEAIAIGPVMWIKVTEDHDAIFCEKSQSAIISCCGYLPIVLMNFLICERMVSCSRFLRPNT